MKKIFNCLPLLRGAKHISVPCNGRKEWAEDNPAAAAREFAVSHPEFIIKRPTTLFGDEYVIESMIFWPDVWLKRVS